MFDGSKPRIRRPVPPFLFTLVLASSLLHPASGRGDCLLGYASCVDAASELDSFAKRSFAGLRCFVDLVSCLQSSLA
jgi:hypothetical protein